MGSHVRGWKTLVAVIAVGLTLASTAPALAQHAPARARDAGGIGFGPATVVDDQHEGGEPDVKVCGPDATWSYANCGADNPYVSSPNGFSTLASYLWRSEDQGKTFKLVPSNNMTGFPGKPTACPGGGDSELAVSPGATQAGDYLNFADLQGLTNFSTAASSDGGQSFHAGTAGAAPCNALTAQTTGVDRQWFGIYKNPSGAPANGSAIYLDYDIVSGGTASASCPNNIGGNIFVVQKSTDGGDTFNPPVTVDCNDGIAGNMQVNQTNGHVFAAHTAYAVLGGSPATDVVAVNRSTDGGATWTPTVAFTPSTALSGTCTPDCTVGQDFAVLAIDKQGGLYAVWSQAPVNSGGAITGPSHIYYAYSSNEGTTWTSEQQVDAGAANPTGQSAAVDIFPWIAAGDAGKIDVVWYATKAMTTSLDPGSQISDWYPYLSQSLNANGTGATFSTPTPISQHPNHNGGICTMGIGCATGGDRSLVDFFQVDVNKEGGADVIFADTSNNSNTSASGNALALNMEARQISGPTLFGPSLTGASSTCTAVTSAPCQADQTGDAKYEVNGTIGNNIPKADITGSSVNISPTDSTNLDVRMNLADLSSLPSITDTNNSDYGTADTYVDYLTSWNYHVPGHTQADYDATGNIYYAYLEVDRKTGAVTAYDGNTCGIVTTKDKYLVYPGQNTIPFKVDPTAKTVDLYAPLADVGKPSVGATLYSVTAHTVGQAAPASTGPSAATCATMRDPNGNAADSTGQIFDVYDKSPAYTALLTTPAIGPGRPPTTTPEPGSGELYGAGLVVLIAGVLAWRRRAARRG